MHKETVTKLLVILIILFGVTVINTMGQTPENDSATGSRKIQVAADCERDLQIANQRLEKTLDALEQAESVIKMLKTEIVTREKLEKMSDDLISKKDEIITWQAKLIAEYEKRKGVRISFLFGLISIRKN